MEQKRKHAAGEAKKSPDEDTTGPEFGTDGGDGCRCKEVSKKSSLELLRLMLSDLAFWKKPGNTK